MIVFRYYDRAGRPMSQMEWAVAFERPENAIVEQTTLPNGRWVSTVWLGLDHGHGDGPPLIFETLVFRNSGGHSELDCASEEEAHAGHARMVEKWTRKKSERTN